MFGYSTHVDIIKYWTKTTTPREARESGTCIMQAERRSEKKVPMREKREDNITKIVGNM